MNDKQLNDLPEDAQELSGAEMRNVQGGLGIVGGSQVNTTFNCQPGGGLSLLGQKDGDDPPKTGAYEPCKHDPSKNCCY